MKYRSFKIENHPILSDVALDFTDATGHAVDTIIFAGENGCGKTLLLNELYNLGRFIGVKRCGWYTAEIELNAEDIELLNSDEDVKKYIHKESANYVLKIAPDNSAILNQIICLNSTVLPLRALKPNNFPLFKGIFSNVEINFNPKSIKSVTSQNVDQKFDSYMSTENLATEISQLLVDIKSLDDSELADWVEKNGGQAPPKEIIAVRMNRFINAFNRMFEEKRFKMIDNQNGEKVIIFEENGRTMTIDELSSGEKQIVFRGGFLLKDRDSIKGAFVLVDEPEISLHPKWQMKILPFIKGLFTDSNGNQTSQIFIATHSPFIVHNDNRQNDKVLVLRKSQGKIEVVDNPEFYSWGETKLVREAFNITLDYEPNKKKVFVEGETDEQYYNKAIEVFNIDRSKVSIEWIGQKINGRATNTGKDALNSAKNFLESTGIVKSPVYLLYDCDTNKPRDDEGNLHIRCMNKNQGNTLYKKGVENLLVLPQNFDPNPYYDTRNEVLDYGEENTIRVFDKFRLCDAICNLSDVELKTILSNIKVEIENIIND